MGAIQVAAIFLGTNICSLLGPGCPSECQPGGCHSLVPHNFDLQLLGGIPQNCALASTLTKIEGRLKTLPDMGFSYKLIVKNKGEAVTTKVETHPNTRPADLKIPELPGESVITHLCGCYLINRKKQFKTCSFCRFAFSPNIAVLIFHNFFHNA